MTKINLKITFLKFHPNPQVANKFQRIEWFWPPGRYVLPSNIKQLFILNPSVTNYMLIIYL